MYRTTAGHPSAILDSLYNHKNDYAYAIGHKNKLFIMDSFDSSMAEIFGPVKNAWDPWSQPEQSSDWPCFVSWKDSILMFADNSVQMYNSSIDEWTILNTNLPFSLVQACVVLPNDNILLADYYYDNNKHLRNTYMYDIIGKSSELIDHPEQFDTQSLINLNDRIFSFGISNDKNGEFHYQNKSWTPISAHLIFDRHWFSSIAVPADLFSNRLEGCEGIH